MVPGRRRHRLAQPVGGRRRHRGGPSRRGAGRLRRAAERGVRGVPRAPAPAAARAAVDRLPQALLRPARLLAERVKAGRAVPRDDPKPLVLCADDFALDAGVSDGIVGLARQGRLSATSVMTLSPRWPQDAKPLAELRGRIDVGLHLDWTSPFARAAGHGLPLAAAMRRALLGGFDRAAARAVIARQLDRFEAAWQAPPDHVDGHQHVQQFAGIRDALLALLTERYPRQPPYLRVSRVLGGAGQAPGVKARIISALGARALARGGGLVMCHPASAAESDDEIGAARRREDRYLAGDRFAEALARAGATLVRGVSHYTRRR